MPLESDVLDWAAASNKHHCLKTCGCFTFVKKTRDSSTYIVYSPQFEFGDIFFCVFFCFLKYLYILLSAVYVKFKWADFFPR